VRRAILIACALAAATLPAAPARAATVDIDVQSNFFSPSPAHPVAGDTIRWTVQSGGHDVVAYAGTMSFASPFMTSGDPAFTQTYAGGEVLYRCSPHSFIGSNGVCSGMCGVLSDRTAAPAAPTIATPAAGSTVPVGNVTFSGTSEPWTIVRLREAGTPLADVLADGDGGWSIVRSMGGDTHTIEARADAADGTIGGSATVTFTVSGARDTIRPTVAITSGALTAGVGTVGVIGEAMDNVAVARVWVRAYDVFGDLIGEAPADCPSCGSPRVAWTATIQLPRGVATIRAMAEDTAGNDSTQSNWVRAVTL